MPFNGSGVFTRLYNWANDVAASIKIRADRFDAEMDGFATGLSTCMTKDGQQLPTAAQNFNGQNLTNVGAFGSTGTNTFSGTTTLFSGSAARIQGDFSNATYANRTALQDKTTNNSTVVTALPNGTSQVASFSASNNSDPTNAAYFGIGINSSTATLTSSTTGSGTALPLTVLVGASGTEAARFDTNANFMVGRTSYAFLSNSKGTTLYNSGQVITETDASLTPFLINTFNGGVSNNNAVVFYRQGTVAGYIYTSNGNTTTYSTSSDYRLKTNAQPLTGSGAFIDALQPKTWTWISSGTAGVGLIAHEAATVAPLSVSGQKDEVDADGNPKYQAIGYGSSEFIANIIAELKSLRARVATLEARP
jgi:hypothetical protein